SSSHLSFLMTLLPPRSTLFPYTTLFRSHQRGPGGLHPDGGKDRPRCRSQRNHAVPRRHRHAGLPSLSSAREDGHARFRHGGVGRSEEHTSNSSHVAISYAVFCLKKKKDI